MSPLLPDEARAGLPSGIESTAGSAVSREGTDHRLDERFHALAAEWKEGRGYSSSIGKLCSHPAYQQIIGMGESAVPLILRELERAPDHWFWALKAITAANPVSREERADIKAMAGHWIEWGRKEGYRW